MGEVLAYQQIPSTADGWSRDVRWYDGAEETGKRGLETLWVQKGKSFRWGGAALDFGGGLADGVESAGVAWRLCGDLQRPRD